MDIFYKQSIIICSVEVDIINKTRELLANNIIYFRHKRDWSQETLADKLGSSAAYISQLENAKRNVTADFLDKLAACFQIEQHELLIKRTVIINKRVNQKGLSGN